MRRFLGLIALLAWSVAGSTGLADSPQAELASRAWAITETILARHIDPPTRQEMLMAGFKAVDGQMGHRIVNRRLALRVSNLANAEQLAELLADPVAKYPTTFEKSVDEVFTEGLLSVVPGRVFLLSAKERKVTESFEANLYVGIQVALGLDEKTKKPEFNQIFPGGPADLAGIQPNDLIEEIEGVATEGVPLRQIIDRLRGEEGTNVVLKVSRPAKGEVFDRTLTRNRMPRSTIEGLAKLEHKKWKVRINDSAIGYLKIKEISGSTPRELRSFAQQLEAEGAKALVLDLRETQTAGFHSTVLLADALLDGGVIGRVASPEGERILKAEPDALFRDWPMVVLTKSVSIGEVAWLADALGANRKATILGANLVNDDPVVREMVAIDGGPWSLQMPTGRLEQADGKPLAMTEHTNRGSNENFADYNQRLRRSVIAQPKPADPEKLDSQNDLAKARSILENALKSAGISPVDPPE
jgi:carboxyl-terminal processing protease